MIVDIKTCARCGLDHLQLEFKKFTRPFREFTHFASCPSNLEPIILRILDIPEDDPLTTKRINLAS